MTDLITQAKERFEQALDFEADLRSQMKDDYKFLWERGAQWDSEAKKQREEDSRPCLEINRLKPFVRSVTNEQRQMRPSIKVLPADNGADIDTAKVLQGLVRNIEVESGADSAYDQAGEHAATMGRGFIRVVTDYVGHDTFDQCIYIKRIRDPFAVVIDPSIQEADGSDANWGFVVTEMAKDDFKAEFPKSKAFEQGQSWDLLAEQSDGWMSRDSIRVAEYFYKVETPDTLLLFADGTTAFKSDYKGALKPIKTRPSSKCQWKWAKLTCNEVLEEQDWPGRYLPIVPVFGEEYIIDGKPMYSGIVFSARDSQVLYNISVSNELEIIGLMPKAPWVAEEGAIEGFEQQWQESNRRAVPVLQYKSTNAEGERTQMPTRNLFEAPIGALSQTRALAAEDLKASTGIFDASLGARSNETSGRAILARQQQSSTANFHYIDNLNRAIRHIGKILIDLIPHIYSTKRVINIIGDANEQELITINGLFEKNGEAKMYDFSAGRYDVIISTGPASATKRQENAQALLEMAQADPMAMQIGADLIYGSLDFDSAREMAKRRKKMLPPGVGDDENSTDPAVKLSQAEQMLQQQQQQLEALNAHAQQLEAALAEAQTTKASDDAKLQLQAQKLELDTQIAEQKLAVEQAKVEAQMQKQALDAELQRAELELERQKLQLERAKLAVDARKAMTDEDHLLEGLDEMAGMVAENVQAVIEAKLREAKQEIVETVLDAPISIDIEKTGTGTATATITQ